MNNAVTLKGSKNGLTILVNEPMRYDEFLEELKIKFINSNGFFKDSKTALSIKGILLTERQEYEVISMIEFIAQMHIICILDNDEITNSRFIKAINDKQYLINNQNGLFFRGNIKKRECLETFKSVIILGDVEAGGRVISKGNVIVLGNIYGCVSAGIDNDCFNFISSLGLNFEKIQIGDVILSNDDRIIPYNSKKPQIIYRKKERICIRNLN